MSSLSKESYRPLMQEDEDDSTPTSSQLNLPRKASSCLRPILISLSCVFGVFLISLVTVLITAAFHSYSHAHDKPSNPSITTPQQPLPGSGSPIQQQQAQSARWSSCGTDPETARSRNCTFDLISFTWQTPECYDADLTANFTAWDSWNWYADEFSDDIVPHDVAVLGERDTWVSWDYHIVHCTFMWLQMHRAFERGWIGHHLHVYDHTVHCQKTLLKNGEPGHEVFRTPARVLYPRCERVGSAAGMYPGAQFRN